MTQKEFMQELEEATHAKEKLVEKVKSYGLPVMIFGAGNYAVEVTKILNKYGLEVAGYAVDEEYYQPNKIFLNRPIYNFEELYRKPKDQIFFVGIGLNWANHETFKKSDSRRNKFFADKNIICYDFCPPTCKCEPLTYEFIVENKEKFLETYDMLSDDLSKKTFMIYLKAQISDVMIDMESVHDPREYFNEFTAPAVCGGGGFS